MLHGGDLSAENVFSPGYKAEILTMKTRSTEEQTVKFTALYRDFNNKLHKVNGVFRPLQCFKLPEILCSIITRVAFLKIENKKLTIGQIEEL